MNTSPHLPEQSAEARRADIHACHEILTRGSKSFVAASRLLPKRLHDRTAALYAFCRVADDAVDLGTDVPAAIARLLERLDRVYAGRPEQDPVDRAFCEVVHTCGIPQAVPRALIEGFEWDAERRRYATERDLEAYCARVAATVGVMMTLLFGERSKVLLARACDLGLAMQLTNICRDVGEDARAGRMYLPLAPVLAGLAALCQERPLGPPEAPLVPFYLRETDAELNFPEASAHLSEALRRGQAR